MKNQLLADIETLLCDATVGDLKNDDQILNDDEELGALLTLTSLRKQIYPITEALGKIIPKE